jgi:hypothetical protein
MAPGSITQTARIKSNWKVNAGDEEIDGLIGQYGSWLLVVYAAHAKAAHIPS